MLSAHRLPVVILGAIALLAGLLLGRAQLAAPEPDAASSALPRPLTAMTFELTDQDGEPVGPESLIGQPSLVFFGFTSCPDVCPMTLSDISGWLERLGPAFDELQVVFITVDPERDTVPVLEGYVAFFDERIQGWTGTAEQIGAAAEGFRVRYEKVPLEDGNYTMDHTATVFLYRADGTFKSTIDLHEPREVAVPKIRGVLPEQRKKTAS